MLESLFLLVSVIVVLLFWMILFISKCDKVSLSKIGFLLSPLLLWIDKIQGNSALKDKLKTYPEVRMNVLLRSTILLTRLRICTLVLSYPVFAQKIDQFMLHMYDVGRHLGLRITDRIYFEVPVLFSWHVDFPYVS